MKAKNQPLTQAQFDKSMKMLFATLEKKADKKEIQEVKRTMATKKELELQKNHIEKFIQDSIDANMILVANAFERVATKEDLKDYPTRAELKETIEKALEPYATKKDMKEIIESAIERFESSVFTTLRNHEKRITSLEQA